MNMKTYMKLFYVALLSITFGCNDAIDIDQPGRLSPETAFESIADFEQGLFSLYNQLDTTPEIAFASNFCDEIAIGQDNGGQGIALYNLNLNPTSGASFNFWVRNFRVNNRVTVFLEAAAGFTPEPGEEAAFNNILGQARAIRAFANFELVNYFSPDPRDDSSLAVPLIDFVAPLNIQPLRDTTGEMFDFIESDLDFAVGAITDQANTTFWSKDGVNALRARIAAVRGDYVTAGNLAQSLLNAYPIANRVQYQLMFLDADNTEIIFKLERTLNDSYDGQGATGGVSAGGWAGARFAFVNPSIAGGSYFEMDRGLFNLIDPTDIRFDVNLHPTSVINPNYEQDNDRSTDILLINKYPGSEGQPLMNDLKIFRSSEMLFILAEARAIQGNFSGVAQLLSELRTARLGSPQPLLNLNSTAGALAAILDEKRVEFAFEGHRYRDLKRIGAQANKGIERDPTDCVQFVGSTANCTLPATDFRMRALPIPIEEINANPGIGEQQNPGY
jgi:hypothetical protein